MDTVESYVKLNECTPSYEILDGYIELIKDKLEYLPKAQSGGANELANEYYAKYMKYKLKYLAIRNKI